MRGFRGVPPYCIAGRLDFVEAMRHADATPKDDPQFPFGISRQVDAVAAMRWRVLHEERPCDDFTQWVPGLSLNRLLKKGL